MKRIALLLALAAPGCAAGPRAPPAVSAPPPGEAAWTDGMGGRYGPERRFEGAWFTGFETSRFEGCWLTFSGEAGRALEPHVPQISIGRAYRFQLVFIGRQTLADEMRRAPQGYGHMGMSACEIRAARLISVRALPLE